MTKATAQPFYGERYNLMGEWLDWGVWKPSKTIKTQINRASPLKRGQGCVLLHDTYRQRTHPYVWFC